MRKPGHQAGRRGRLYGIGAGPGPADLLTLRAVRLLGEVPVVFVPRGDTGDESMALSIIRPFLSGRPGGAGGYRSHDPRPPRPRPGLG